MIAAMLSVASVALAFGAYIPYMRDIVRGRALPARSARIMFTCLLILALFQQKELGGGWVLAVTIGEAVGSLMILGLSVKHGVGGLNRLDIICYVLLGLSVLVWQATNNPLLALHFTVIADIVAFTPTLAKTWRWPQSETPTFFLVGAIAPLLSIAAGGDYEYTALLFPLYLSVVNGLELALIYRGRGPVGAIAEAD